MSRQMMEVAKVARSEETKERLLEAAEEAFAGGGAWTVPLSQIVRAAGQRNESAIQYHFGSRGELIFAVLERGRTQEIARRMAMLEEIERDPGPPDLRRVVAALVDPAFGQLSTVHGRRIRLIIADVVRGIDDRALADARPPDAVRVNAQLDRCFADEVPPTIRRARRAAALRLQIEALADRARTLERGTPPLLSTRAFRDNLVAMIVGLLGAPSNRA